MAALLERSSIDLLTKMRYSFQRIVSEAFISSAFRNSTEDERVAPRPLTVLENAMLRMRFYLLRSYALDNLLLDFLRIPRES